MIEFTGELHDQVLGFENKGFVSIVEEGEEWEGSIDLNVATIQEAYILKQGETVRGRIRVDFIGEDEEGFHAHFIGVGPLRRL